MRNGGFNGEGVLAIYRFEMARALRTLWQSLVTPVITTALYFVVFGAAIGGRMAALLAVDSPSSGRSLSAHDWALTKSSPPSVPNSE